MKIGLTGGTGFIGQYVLREISKNNQCFIITSRDNIENLYLNDNIHYIKEEYTREGFLNVFDGCDAIIHLGFQRSTVKTEQSIENYFSNIVVSEELFSSCEEMGIKNIVNISSTAVYDSCDECEYPFSEQNKTSPLSLYGTSKQVVENIAELFNKKHGMCIKSLRLAQVLGLGERKGYLLSIYLERCLAQQSLDVYGTGEYGREYIYIKDVVSAIITALSFPEKKGVYNIGSGVLTTNVDLAKSFCTAFDNIKGYNLLTDRPENKVNYLMDVKKAEKELCFKCKYTLLSALLDMKNMIKEGYYDKK